MIKFKGERFFEFDWEVEESEDVASLKVDPLSKDRLPWESAEVLNV